MPYPTDGNGANHSGPYDPTCNGSPSLNGAGDGNATGEPCAGCVGQSNPAHTGCTFFQIDLYTGPVVENIPANGILFPQQVFDWAFGH